MDERICYGEVHAEGSVVPDVIVKVTGIWERVGKKDAGLYTLDPGRRNPLEKKKKCISEEKI